MNPVSLMLIVNGDVKIRNKKMMGFDTGFGFS
jgi:hypothetical protein